MDNALSLLGLALRGGNLAVGDEPAADACGSGRARTMVLASDAAERTARRARRLAEEREVPLVRLPWGKDQVGAALGRPACAVAALTDAGLAAAFLKRLAEADGRYAGAADAMEKTAARFLRRKRKKS